MVQKQKRLALHIVAIALGVLSAREADSQVLNADLPRNRRLTLAEEQYQQGHYTLAAQSAREYLATRPEKVNTEKAADLEKGRYYLVMSGLKTSEKGIEQEATDAVKTISNPAYNQRISFTLAQYHFRKGEYATALPIYEATAKDNLDKTEQADEKFEMGYCYFVAKNYKKAEGLFLGVTEQKDNKYYIKSNYYYGLMLYNDNKYDAALRIFNRVKDEQEYSGVVPYYIAEIYYFKGKRDSSLAMAETLMRAKEKSAYDVDLHLLAAQCLYEMERYKEAKPYFQYYYDRQDKIKKQILYKMAYCDYRTSDWNRAIEKFKQLNSTADSLGQTAMYLLGDCYLQVNNKPGARNAFGFCADMKFNPSQQEAAMMLYSRLSNEMGYNDDALRQLKALLAAYPSSIYRDEANTLISGLLVKTNNNEEALKHLDAVRTKDNNYWQVYQRASFGFAVQQFRKGELNSAMAYFGRSLQHPVDKDYESAAWFWKGEIAYRLKDYAEVIAHSQEFISHLDGKQDVGNISPLATAQHAYLNMGYASMERENYTSAQMYFGRAQQSGGKDKYTGTVALMKEADAVFLQKNYNQAIVLYDKIIAGNDENADYARYQKSILLGLLGKNSEKVALLTSMIRTTPPSGYANHARYELAVTYMEDDKFPQALMYLHQLTDSVSDKSFAPGAWMKTGFIYQQTHEDTKAIEAYKHVLIDYPASEDRMAALDALRNLYIEVNQPAAYTQLLRDHHLPSADSSGIDSTYYAAAEAQFAAGKMEQARIGFANYLQQYPNGIFAVKAHYYRGESNYQLKRFKDAREDYSYILEGPWNDFYENSARRAATIAYDAKDYTAAYDYYLKLRESTTSQQMRDLAIAGLMKSGYYANKFSETVDYADTLINIPGTSAETVNEALYFKARSLQQTDRLDDAASVYEQLARNKNGDIAAEARYHIAEMLLRQGKLKEAEDAAGQSIKLSAGYDYWVVKSYLVLADILIKQKDYFNAKATLQSIVKHTKIAEVKAEANKRLEEVKALEKKQTKLSED